MAEVTAVNVEPSDRVQKARDPGFVVNPLGERQGFVECRQRGVVSAGFVTGYALNPEAPEQRGDQPVLPRETHALLGQREALAVPAIPGPQDGQRVKGLSLA